MGHYSSFDVDFIDEQFTGCPPYGGVILMTMDDGSLVFSLSPMRGSYSQQAVINVKLDMFVPRAEELFLKTKPALKLKGFIPLTGKLFLKNGKCKMTEVSLSLVRGNYSRGVACGLDNIPFVLRTEELFLAKLPNFAKA